MYDGDSFYTLGLAGQAGLLVLSLFLSIGTVWLAWRLSRRARWITRALIGLGVYVVFTWISPQVYYAYYLQIIDGLPVQWVVRWPPELAVAIVEFTFTGRFSLAAHGRGILGWMCILVPLAFGRFQPPVRHH
ncbi:MAG: hypothetical protein AAF557_13795 [Pseudomonadota bacterium]